MNPNRATEGKSHLSGPLGPTCPLRPLAGYCVIAPIAKPKKSAGGILLPDEWRGKGAKRKRERDPKCGTVAAVAPRMRCADGSFVETALRVGDAVVYLSYTDSVEWDDADGVRWHIVEQDDVLTVVDRAEGLVVEGKHRKSAA